jgi:pimeloyl-ACP methyl ester carboxylesterase
MSHRRIERVFQVPAGASLPRSVQLGATFHLPERPDPARPVLFLFPGATYARGYYDIQAAGFDGYSQAERHVADGFVCVAMDYLGNDGAPYADANLTLGMIGAGCDAGVRAALAELAGGGLDPAVPPLKPAAVIGVGQSMGGHVVLKTQADHETFDGVAFLGSSFTQTRLALKPGARPPSRDAPPVDVMRSAMDADMLACFHWPETPAELVAADDLAARPTWRSQTFPPCGSQLLLPGILAREAAAIRVPVLLAYGEIDVTGEPLNDAAAFRSTADLTLLVLPRMAHMHNFAPTRETLWRRLARFAETVAEGNA